MTPFEVLFSVTVYRDGQIRIGGRPRSGSLQNTLPDVLRMVAHSIESGATVLTEEDD